MTVQIYGIPACGTVQKALRCLVEAGVPHTFVDFRLTPPDKPQVERWAKTFGVRAMRNTSGGSYRALPADKDAWSDAAWVERFASDPMLIKRPVFERDGVPVAVGFRDPSRILAALDHA